MGDFNPGGPNIAGSGVSDEDGDDLETVMGVDGNTTTKLIFITSGDIVPSMLISWCDLWFTVEHVTFPHITGYT